MDRWRNKWVLSSREVKSTGEKALVVIFPSTVMAKVTATNGRFGLPMWEGPLCPDLSRRTKAAPTLVLLFFLGDFMLEGFVFLFHVAHPDVAGGATWFVEEINDAARQGADQDNDET